MYLLKRVLKFKFYSYNMCTFIQWGMHFAGPYSYLTLINTLLFLLIFVSFIGAFFISKTYKGKKFVISFILTFIKFFIPGAILSFFLFLYWIGTTCYHGEPNYTSDKEFIQNIGIPGSLYEKVTLDDEAAINIGKTQFTFACSNDECTQQISISNDGKKLRAKEYTRGVFYSCANESIVWFHSSIGKPSEIVRKNCINHMYLSEMPWLGSIPLPKIYYNDSHCSEINIRGYSNKIIIERCLISWALLREDPIICEKIEDLQKREECKNYTSDYISNKNLRYQTT
jgi:hypothetical protein